MKDELSALRACCSFRWIGKFSDLNLALAKFSYSKILYHGQLDILFLTEEQDIHWFVYNFMDLYVMIKFTLFTTKHGTVGSQA